MSAPVRPATAAPGVVPGAIEPTAELARLLDERAIRRVLYSYCRGIDRIDLELVRDCYWPDATDAHGTFTGQRDGFIDWVGPLLRRHTMTMHAMANILIDFPPPDSAGPAGLPPAGPPSADPASADSAPADVALTETYGVAYHSGEPAGDIRWNFAAGFRYVDRFERRDGQWRIADRITVIEWVQPWEADRDRAGLFGRLARRDQDDPVFTRTVPPAGPAGS